MVMDDRTLVRRMLRGDELAFQQFFDTYFGRLSRFAMARLGDPDAADEAVQATLVLGFRKLHTWRGEAALFTWLCTICRREIAALLERSNNPRVTGLVDDDPEIRARLEALAAQGVTPETALDRAELARLVRLTLDYLPTHYAEVLQWKYLEEVAVKEIADRLGASPKAAESLLTRARQGFREGFRALTGRDEPWPVPE